MGSDKFKSTRRMILSRVLLVPFVTVMLVFGTLVYYFAANLRHQAEEKLVNIATGHRDLIEQFLRERAFDLQYVFASNSIGEITDDVRLAEIFERLQTRSRAFLDIGVFDENGNHVAYIGPYDLRGKNYARSEWFQRVQGKSPYISDVFLGYRNIPHFVIAVRRDEAGHPWYLRATIDTLFFDNLVENIRVGKTGEAYLINRDGVFQTPRRSGGNLMEVDPDHRSYQADDHAISSFTERNGTGERYLYATGRLEPTEWLLVARQEIGDAYAPLIRAVLIAVGLIVAGGAVVVFTAFIMASRVANQLTVADMEKQEMGGQLIMAGKLAEVGEMSAGVAHEINNPLQIMKSEEALMNDILDEMHVDGNPRAAENIRLLRDSVDQVGVQIDRCKRITHGLLKFARKSQTKIQPVDPHLLIAEVVDMVEHVAQLENILFIQELEPELPVFRSDPLQLQQVFLNLFNNAIDAVKQKGGGEIRVTVSRAGDDLKVSVADTGCGIAPEHMQKIFLPFFTTKPVGQGTGLGLSTSYGIVERLGGQITVSSELNVGTVFTVRLPLAGPSEEVRSRTVAHEQGGGGRDEHHSPVNSGR